MRPARSIFLFCIAVIGLPYAHVAAQADSQNPPELSAITSAQVGWGGWIRQGRWNLARADVQSSVPVAAELEWYVPQVSRRSMRIGLEVVLNPATRTIQAVLPVGPSPETVHANLRSTAGSRLLGHWQDAGTPPLPERLVSENAVFVAVAGAGEAFSAVDDPRLTIGVEHERMLPVTEIGFDAFDLLFLDRPNLELLPAGQQQAVLDWLAGGGIVLLQLDLDTLPAASPLLGALPALPRRVSVPGDTERIALGEEVPQGDVTTVTVGRGRVGILHAPLQHFSPEERAALLLEFASPGPATPSIGPETPADDAGPPRSPRGGITLLLLAALVGPVDVVVARLGGRRPPRWTLAPSALLAAGGAVLLLLSAQSPDAPAPAFDAIEAPAVVRAVGEPQDVAIALDDAGAAELEQWWRIEGQPRPEGPLLDIPFRQTPTGTVPASDAFAPYRIELRSGPG